MHEPKKRTPREDTRFVWEVLVTWRDRGERRWWTGLGAAEVLALVEQLTGEFADQIKRLELRPYLPEPPEELLP
jgi:hypothetical protein